jgi:hypothetical protein
MQTGETGLAWQGFWTPGLRVGCTGQDRGSAGAPQCFTHGPDPKEGPNFSIMA